MWTKRRSAYANGREVVFHLTTTRDTRSVWTAFTGIPSIYFLDGKKSFPNIRSALSDIEIRCSPFWVRMQSLGITMPLSVHFVILLSSGRFRGISPKRGQDDICDCSLLQRHADSKISHF